MTVRLIIGWLAALLAGCYLHEITHWVTARLVGAKARIHWLERFVEYELPNTEPLWKDRVIGLSPLLVGLCVGLPALALWGAPSSSRGIFAAIAWVIYTFYGSVQDVSVQAAHKSAEAAK